MKSGYKSGQQSDQVPSPCEYTLLELNSEFFVLLGPSCEWYKLQEFQDYFNNYSEAADHGVDISGGHFLFLLKLEKKAYLL